MKKEKQDGTKYFIAITAIFAVLILLILLISGTFNSKPKDKINLNSISQKNLIHDDSMKGNPDAPITIIEFSDYECFFCQRFYETSYQQIKENYIDTGKINLVFRDFPLSSHLNAKKAAEAAECAGEQNKYYEMHDKLFEEGVDGGIETFKKYANEIGLNQEQFDLCLDSGAMAIEIKKDISDGMSYGVSGTPTFIINGKIIVGAQPYELFEKEIEAALYK